MPQSQTSDQPMVPRGSHFLENREKLHKSSPTAVVIVDSSMIESIELQN